MQNTTSKQTANTEVSNTPLPQNWHVDCKLSKLDPRENEYNIKATDGQGDFTLATINGFYFGPHSNEPRRIAALMAAAPKLLHQLVQVASTLQTGQPFPKTALSAINAAIEAAQAI